MKKAKLKKALIVRLDKPAVYFGKDESRACICYVGKDNIYMLRLLPSERMWGNTLYMTSNPHRKIGLGRLAAFIYMKNKR